MKSLLFTLLLVAESTLHSEAQKRISVSTMYWFNYNPYSYQATNTYNGIQARFLASGYNIVSSFGLVARYHFTSQWDVSIGALYNSNTNHIKNPPNPYGDPAPFTTSGLRLPVLVNYRLTDRRLSPYFSAGASFTNNKTFTDAPVDTEGSIGVGAHYRLYSGLAVLILPTAGYSFTKPVNDTFYQTANYSSYSLGLLTQLIWRF